MPHQEQGTSGDAGVAQKNKWLVGKNEFGAGTAPPALHPPHGSQPARMNSEGGDGAARIDGALPNKDGKATSTACAGPFVHPSKNPTPTGVVLGGPGQLAPTHTSAGLHGGGSAKTEGRFAPRASPMTPGATTRMAPLPAERAHQIQGLPVDTVGGGRASRPKRKLDFNTVEEHVDAHVRGESMGPPPPSGVLQRSQSITPGMPGPNNLHLNCNEDLQDIEIEYNERGEEETHPIDSADEDAKDSKRPKYAMDIAGKNQALKDRRGQLAGETVFPGDSSLFLRCP